MVGNTDIFKHATLFIYVLKSISTFESQNYHISDIFVNIFIDSLYE